MSDKRKDNGRKHKYKVETSRKIFLFPKILEYTIKIYIEEISKPYLSDDYKTKKK